MKVDRMPAITFGEKYQMVKTMSVRKNKALMFVDVIRKPCDHDMVFAVFGKRADIEPWK